MSKKIIPLPGFVVLERVEYKQELPGGLQLPDTAKEQPSIGKVIAVTPLKDEESPVKVGETVHFEKFGVHEIFIDFKEFIVSPFDKLLDVIEDVK